MNRIFPLLKNSILILTFVLFAYNLSPAQDDDGETVVRSTTNSVVVSRSEDEKEDKSGSTVRGRVFYENSQIPVRRGWVGLQKIRDLVEKKVEKGEGNTIVARESGGDNYVLTGDNGEFVMKSVKPGIYQPTFKVAGILNRSFLNGETQLYQSITVDGIGEVNVQIPAKRGGSVSGRVEHFDNSPVVGAKIRLVSKNWNERIYSMNNEIFSTITDDRGFYHLAGLPDGDYFVSVVEPSVHTETGGAVSEYNISSRSSGSILTTFYPGVSKTENATAISLAAGQEQNDINILIPDRRLFRISGAVIVKNNPTPLKNLKITFEQVGSERSYDYYAEQSKQMKPDEQGNWAFVDLPKGKYLIRAQGDSDQYRPNPAANAKLPKLGTVSKEIEIDNENIQNVVLELSGESVISGTVSVEGGKNLPSNIYLSAFDVANRNEASAALNDYSGGDKPQTDKTTKPFRLGTLSAGKYILSATAFDKGFYVKSIRSGSIDLMSAPLEIGAGAEIGGIEIVLATDVGTLTGKINNFTAADRVFVILLPVNRSGMSMLTNSAQGVVGKDGEFKVTGAPGEYYAGSVSENTRPNLDNLTEWLTKLVADAPKITLKPNETVTTTLNSPKK